MTLEILQWAIDMGVSHDGAQLLGVPNGEDLDTRMLHSVATGKGLASNGLLGVDHIRVAAGHGFTPHTHPGDHILIVVAGKGTITFDGEVHPTRAGEVYMVDGSVPHAVGAITDHAIMAVGAPHKPVDSLERMTPVEYQAVAAEFGDMACHICNALATKGHYLHEENCAHCPCGTCVPAIMEPGCGCDSCTEARFFLAGAGLEGNATVTQLR